MYISLFQLEETRAARVTLFSLLLAATWTPNAASAACPAFDPENPGASFCTAECPCELGEGDCDVDNQCVPGLACIQNIGASFGFDATLDVCAPPSQMCDAFSPERPDPGQCTSTCGCDIGEGDCDVDAECPRFAACVQDRGARYGLPEDYDVCEFPVTSRNVQMGLVNICPLFSRSALDDGLCTEACPCGVGEGDCDSDTQCLPGLACMNDRGKAYGLPGNYDVCELPNPSCKEYSAEHPNPDLCTNECPCRVGEGDCDDDLDCFGDLVCGQDQGARFGLDPTYDVCVPPATVSTCPAYASGVSACTAACPCDMGGGDCDDDTQCAGALVCRQDVGAMFGMPADWDVCALPEPTGFERPHDECMLDYADKAREHRATAARMVADGTMEPPLYLAIVKDRSDKISIAESTIEWACGPDNDDDLIPDSYDRCAGTPALTPTFDDGCPDPALPTGPSGADVRRNLDKMGMFSVLEACQSVTWLETPRVVGKYNNTIVAGVRLYEPKLGTPAGCKTSYVVDYVSGQGTVERVYVPEFSPLRQVLGGYTLYFRDLPSWAPNANTSVKRFRVRAVTPNGIMSAWSGWK